VFRKREACGAEKAIGKRGEEASKKIQVQVRRPVFQLLSPKGRNCPKKVGFRKKGGSPGKGFKGMKWVKRRCEPAGAQAFVKERGVC